MLTPRRVFTANGFLRRGRTVAMKTTLDRALADVPSVRHVVVCERLPASSDASRIDWNQERDHWWHELIPQQPVRADTVPVPAENTP